MDADLRTAIETIRRSAHDIMRDWAVLLAFEYLHARTPVKSPARAEVERVKEEYVTHHRALDAPGRAPWATVKRSIDRLAEVVQDLPPVQTITTPAQLRALTNDVLGRVVENWSHVNPNNVRATVVGNHLCETCGPTTGQTVVLARDGVPVAQVPLAVLLAWAGDGVLSRLPGRPHVA
jgi:hypothetical protein